MTERKVMNKYYPPDFDPSKLLPMRMVKKPRVEQRGPKCMNIRMMLPFSMCCSHCGEYLYIATKFNSRCQKLPEKSSLGLNVYRFYGKCKHCLGEFSFRTDPEHSDYVLETGGTRTYEGFKDADFAEAEVSHRKTGEENESETKAMENRIYDTAEEMRRLDELDELKAVNRRQAQRDQLISSALDKLFDGDVSGGSSSLVMKGEKKEEGSGGDGVKKEGEDEQEEKLNDGDTAVAEAVFKGDLEWERIEVISDDDEEGTSTGENRAKSSSSSKEMEPRPPPVHIADEVEAAAAKRKAAMPHMVFKAKKKAKATSTAPEAPPSAVTLGAALGGYGSSSSSDGSGSNGDD
ncbi:Cell cycle control protein cwf16, putative [Perkinsus marinus ATCC 50983]|uniref:Splicing factor YJU2 n=1 Tax=Perkinsus marinus (strain ATCC 50983 / TXsc) TaxID=423536 RepID=C5KXX9_PERM5|nr:Cell cycle control protein cwf16, putative [Perkinsus marinus ATCC 50983]EER10665.1 Cell cycle control protein cwf16, putative [Perkinsus marinus ATCC 50983]|eukprot:XP_002778870.1 Cell cycle control protein cwf16, putative [Perkinsus marinus ATCC 50983]